VDEVEEMRQRRGRQEDGWPVPLVLAIQHRRRNPDFDHHEGQFHQSSEKPLFELKGFVK
jgi:hypothetical protein